jgi:opacity protein-like surface antigen
MIKRRLLLAGTFIALTSAANAGDLSVATSDWTGVYVGFGLGGGFGDADLSASGSGSYADFLEYDDALDDGEDATDNLPPNTADDGYRQVNDLVSGTTFLGFIQCYLEPTYPSCSGDAKSNASASGDAGEFGLLGRGEIGADYQLDRVVLGLNASYTLSDRNMSIRGLGSGDASFREETAVGVVDLSDFDTTGDGSGQVKSDLNLGNSWSVGGRIGYLLSDSTLLFGTGGYTQMKAEINSRFTGGAGAGYDEINGSTTSYGISADYDIGSSKSEWMDGYYLGAGLETLIFDNFSLKLEYRFADYGKINTAATAGEGDLGTCAVDCRGWNASVRSEADVTDHSLMTTVSFRL